MCAETSFPLLFSDGSTYVYIHEDVVTDFEQARQWSNENERFGVIIGSKDINKECYRIEYLTKPYPGDDSSFTTFTLKDAGHQAFVDQKFKESSGRLAYLGTWHTHPEPYPSPSSVDRKDWNKCLSQNDDRQLFFCIVGTREFRVFRKQGGKFTQMKLIEHI